MSPKTSRLRGGMSLFRVSDDPIIAVIRLTMNTWAEPDLVKVSSSMSVSKTELTHLSQRAGLEKYYPLP